MDRGACLSRPEFGYDARDWARYVDEEPKRDQVADDYERDAFQRDRARILHSYGFRRLADKTQVVSPGQDDFPRTRLTHSLEVAQIARELGAQLGCSPDVTDAAGLAHDLGHPPFGHNGEDALNGCAAGIGGFEGNAQTLRILTRLEAKAEGADGRSAGLNLTRAVLDGVCKYPWAARADTRKFGVYGDDRTVFDWIRAGRADGQRCIEAQVMDWADDVAYSVHDVEDGVHAGHIDLARVDDAEREAICGHACENYSPATPAELAPVLDRLLSLAPLRDLARYDGGHRAQAAAKRATSELTGRFCSAASAATRTRHGSGPFGRYGAELVIPDEIAAECALLKAIAFRYVMRRPGIGPELAAQRRLLTELVDRLVTLGAAGLSTILREAWWAADDDSDRLRVVIDQVAQLTDSAARAWHRRLVGGG
jgi:dGTPase